MSSARGLDGTLGDFDAVDDPDGDPDNLDGDDWDGLSPLFLFWQSHLSAQATTSHGAKTVKVKRE